MGALSGPSRRERQNAAAALSFFAKDHPDLMIPFGAAVIDALNRPEAQTRWECLDILTTMVDHDSRTCDKAVPGAETALFDEESGPVRLAAMRFLCKLGATTENRSERVWPLIDEAIQCYHGDLEFQDMLVSVIDFSAGKLAPSVKKELGARMGLRRLQRQRAAQAPCAANHRQRAELAHGIPTSLPGSFRRVGPEGGAKGHRSNNCRRRKHGIAYRGPRTR